MRLSWSGGESAAVAGHVCLGRILIILLHQPPSFLLVRLEVLSQLFDEEIYDVLEHGCPTMSAKDGGNIRGVPLFHEHVIVQKGGVLVSKDVRSLDQAAFLCECVEKMERPFHHGCFRETHCPNVLWIKMTLNISVTFDEDY